ncbi:ectonucleoside triphosphate diphosphohydrolase 3 isoform X4 [Callorhinchus milii]|uniref:Ectonucleoside triphosphate diphosphohydrolase 3-like n=1 Tax=Callorhinchus milii TaxID=7868 RepID=A0A4W3JCN4_CALMI|nr:ectonucleoside triphosphate diphosphohydrolase 3 isoform X4 [Callorhinchus milii]|eukprot:gi/632960661/ref/XP_007896321.1/ PREDICTED: ectonucleoside triphosphate diphosphohydrolase 3-like isoform X4 [Callorhinchus milii]
MSPERLILLTKMSIPSKGNTILRPLEFTEIMPPEGQVLQVPMPGNQHGKIKIVAAVTVLVFSAIITITITFIYSSEEKIFSKGVENAIVVEASSTSSAIYVYQWPIEKKHNTGLVTEISYCSVKGPGITAYRKNPKQAAKSLLPCLNNTKTVIPKADHSTTRIYFAATNAVRLLEYHDKAAAQTILAEIQHLIKSLPFSFGNFHILSAQELGSFNWITANYLDGRFIQASEAKTTYESPCWPSGYNKTVSMDDLFGSLCTASKRPANYKPDDEITFKGTGNPAKCQELVYLLFDFEACAGKSYCSFDGIYMPKIRGKFMAFSGFYHISRALRLPTSFSVTSFSETLLSFCTKGWAELKFILPDDKDCDIRQYCFDGFLMHTLLIHGYKFSPIRWKKISFMETVNGIHVKWSLGYMLSITNTIPQEIEEIRSKISTTTFQIVLSVFVGTGIISILVICKLML